MTIEHMGHFTAIGMRTPVSRGTLSIDTCAGNDTALRGDLTHWVWANPTNRRMVHRYGDVSAVSVECLWQGTKIFHEGGRPDERTLRGEWRRGKAKRPIGAWAGKGRPLITDPGEARRRIYVPAFRRLVETWLQDPDVEAMLRTARAWPGPVYLRDWDTGRGIDRNGPMSHAWLLAEWLNTGEWPTVPGDDREQG